ncbi:hypothetical protein [Paenibacillus crassostreae]|uniref:Uncharacterized protein n=1 Tax=Paenibacillus crassostreae TaxID=1763538 RepID=A0A167DSL6_9BACL|nr:hypothetical protein [Paenibacillus crassostreae]AOZ91108.1 hypothetical protein LPB68_02065 [Paenibacillus crassostreae]OAB74732.1 hypothetical protein PNBC_11890 [Paenibacillus crassostreae]
MGQVAFWSNWHGQTGNSANMIAVSMLIGTEYLARTIMSHTHWEMSTLESTLIKERRLNHGFELEYMNHGIDALERLAKVNRLEPSKVKDYCVPILRDRLDLIVGTSKPSEEMYVAVNGVIGSILNAAKSYYDLSFIDVHSGTRNVLTNSVLTSSDLIVVNLNQNINVLNDFFNNSQGFLMEKKYIIVIGQYDANSKYTVSNIKRIYKCDIPIYTVPHLSGFMDACNDKSVVEFFLKNQNVRNNHENNIFMTEVRKLAKGIMNAIGIDTRIFCKKGA